MWNVLIEYVIDDSRICFEKLTTSFESQTLSLIGKFQSTNILKYQNIMKTQKTWQLIIYRIKLLKIIFELYITLKEKN